MTEKELLVLANLATDFALLTISVAALLGTAIAILRDVRASRLSLGA